MDIYTKITVLSSAAVLVIQQILKLRIVPLAFANRYPVVTNILLSVAAAIVVTWRTAVQPQAWTDWVVLVGVISVVAAIAYNMTLKNWGQLRAMEGER